MKPSRRRRFRCTATVARVPDGTDPDARETVVANLRCTEVYPLSEQEKERAGMASRVRGVGMYCEADDEIDHQEHQRVITGGKDYRLHQVLPWPQGNPVYLQLLLRDED